MLALPSTVMPLRLPMGNLSSTNFCSLEAATVNETVTDLTVDCVLYLAEKLHRPLE